jgi:tRNA(Ile)-lysidine synthase
MTAINPRVVESFARAAENLASDQDALDSLSSTLLNNACVEGSNNDDASVAYSVAAILDQPPGMRRRMIIEALRLALVGDGEIGSTHVSEVEILLHPAASGKRLSLPGGLEVWREFDALVVKRSVVDSAEYQIAISSVDPDVKAGEFSFTFRRGLPGATYESVIETTRRERARIGFDWMAVALLDCKVPDLLIIRPRRSGERARVIGQRRTKKLKNLMIDHRIPSSRRANWPLVTTPDGRYIWSPGLPPALEFMAVDESKPLAILRAEAI